MASNSPSGERHPNDIRSFLSGPGLRILLGVGAGYVARRLWTHPQDVVDSKLAQLCAAPTISVSALKGRAHHFTHEGQLVLLQDGVVQPLSYLPTAECQNKERLYNNTTGQRAVLKRTEEYYTGQPTLEGDVNKGARARAEFVSRVPFALVPDTILFRKDFFVIVKNAGADQLPLRHERTWEARMDPKVNRVTRNSCLLAGTRLESVFGWLRKRNGLLEIEPCSDFPKKCFTMSRREIKDEIRAQAADADVYPIRTCSVGVGLVSLGLIFSGLYSYV